jgi:hypothetical protein
MRFHGILASQNQPKQAKKMLKLWVAIDTGVARETRL